MRAVTVSQMVAAEQRAIANGWTEGSLLECAGTSLGHAIARQFPQPGTAVAFLGKGHNAGDALIALRILHERYGWTIHHRSAFPLPECAPLLQVQAGRLGEGCALEQPLTMPDTDHPLLLLDGLLGTGGKGPLRATLLMLADEMQWLRQHRGAQVIAIDLPSGMDADSGCAFPGAVTADMTFMIGNAKAGLLTASAALHTGALALVPVPALCAEGDSDVILIAPQILDFAKSPRPHDLHKGSAGTVRVLAGSDRYSGAAVLAATGALRGGAGMVFLHVPHSIIDRVACKCPPEIIIEGYGRIGDLPDTPGSARVIGCGLGPLPPNDTTALFDWIRNSDIPSVIDADALNLIAKNHQHGLLAAHHVITPHPVEFHRLAPELENCPREQAALAFCQTHAPVLLLKGARSLITQRAHALYCNSTGHAGMATAGQGDLLAGVIGSQLASGLPPLQAAALGAWLCGRAAEIALLQAHLSPESLTPSDVLHQLGAAHRDWKSARR